MPITIYNEAGEVVTDPHEQARRLAAYFGPGEVRIYGDDGEVLAMARRIAHKRCGALRALAAKVMRRRA
jgi:hypothetical protein